MKHTKLIATLLITTHVITNAEIGTLTQFLAIGAVSAISGAAISTQWNEFKEKQKHTKLTLPELQKMVKKLTPVTFDKKTDLSNETLIELLQSSLEHDKQRCSKLKQQITTGLTHNDNTILNTSAQLYQSINDLNKNDNSAQIFARQLKTLAQQNIELTKMLHQLAEKEVAIDEIREKLKNALEEYKKKSDKTSNPIATSYSDEELLLIDTKP